MYLGKGKGIRTLSSYLPYIVTGGIFALPAITGSFVWLCFLSPLPVFYYLVALGQERGTKIILRAALAAGILAIIGRVVPVLVFSLSMIPVGFILASSLKKEETPVKAAFKSALYIAATWVFLALAISSAYKANFYSEILNNIDFGLSSAFENYKLTAKLPPETIFEIEAAFTELRNLVPMIFPGIICMTVLGTVWINIISGDWLFKRKSKSLSPWPDFRHWRLPEHLVWGVIVSGVFLFLPGSTFSSLGMNLLMVLGLIYFFQGLAVMASMLEKWTVPVPIKVFLYVLLVVQAYGMLILVALGLADVWLDFRKPRSEPEAPDD